ncbi:hypothetical protein [Butyrivibrio sp. MB2005]|uniref:hypothetical protein n=1 Tax=Butyrivibrio sp. MB2005 TaxID=1280678 RepID=UPI0004167F67|nr:hypothetical protein [Butyrivibrio sp. MB2005]
MGDFTVMISEEGAQSLYEMQKALVESQQRIIDANEALKKTTEEVGDDLGAYKLKTEEIISMTTKAAERGSTAVSTLSSKLGKIADWIMTKIS